MGRRRRRAALLAAAAVALAPALAHAAGEQASDGAANDFFGRSVSASGTAGLVGALGASVGSNASQGAVYLFRNLDMATGTVTQNAKLTASDGAAGDRFGIAVSQSGTIGLVGAFGASSFRGAAYLFRNLDTATGTVTQNVKLNASDGAAGDEFGFVVSQSGTLGLVGAFEATVGGNASQGAAYLFRSLDTATGTVTQSVKLTASDGAAGDVFGNTVSQSGTLGLVGAEYAKVGSNSQQGAAYLFRNLDTATGIVTQNVKLTASDGAAGDRFGFAVSASGTLGLVGSENAKVGSSPSQGAAYLFRNLDTATGNVTQNVKLTASDGAANDTFGNAVSLSGTLGLVAAEYAKVGSNAQQGAAYLFLNLDTVANGSGGSVTQDVKVTASGAAAGDFFGSSVSLSGDAFNIGAVFAAGASAGSGKAYYGTVSSVTTLDAGNANRIISGISFVSQDDWVIGQTTSGNQVTISKGDTANVTATGRGVYVGQAAGSNGNTLLVNGTVVANAVTIGAASGTTGNKLQIANDGGATSAGTVNASGGITVHTGATLLLSGSNTVTDRIGNATPLVLAGGTFNLGGLSEGAAGTTGMGTLSVTATSTLDFGTIGTANALQFAGLGPHTAGAKLQVIDWEGTPATGGGNDELLFAGLASAFTSIYAQSDVTFQGTPGYGTVQDGAYFEVFGFAAAPEPTSLLLLSLGATPMLARRRRA